MQRWQLHQAVRTLQTGGIVAYPTEAIYGLGCDPLNAATVIDLCAIKQRPLEKGLILIASRFKQLKPFLAPLDKATKRMVKSTWPGPVTWLLPAHPDTPEWLTGTHNTIAVRITAHPMAAALCKAFQSPLVSTSANISNHPPARTPLQVQQIFGEKVDLILHGDTGGRKKPTEIRDAATGKTIRTAR
jgi:L-threonylcarbamoyladenylate synthase